MAELDLTCACGAARWRIDAGARRVGIRYICHCDDCQAFAHYTGRPGAILDPRGGTDAYQLPASRVRVIAGLDSLACVQLTARPLLRWFCARCRTPVANTYDTGKLSFVSLPLAAADAAACEAALGPSAGHVWTKFGHGDLSDVKQVAIPAMLWRMGARIVGARLSGDYRNNPFFERDTAQPIRTPVRVSAAERAELDREVKAAREEPEGAGVHLT